MNYILVLNAGSSSLKYKLFNATKEVVYSGSFKNHKADEYHFEFQDQSHEIKQRDFEFAIDYLIEHLLSLHKVLTFE